MHVTAMSVISCHSGFSLNSIRVDDYAELIQRTVQNVKPFLLSFKGVTASPSCIMIQGFPEDNQLNLLRNGLRENFRKSSLQQSIDTRYVLKTAHSTIVRFKAPLQKTSAFLHKLQEYRNYEFGNTEVNELELVYNDWYQRRALVKLLGRYSLEHV